MIPQPDLQLRTLRLYGELLCRRTDWAGQLTSAAFAGAASSGLAAASSLAGAASLTVDADSATMKAHFRDGAYDFVVNTLDEALRALKNEIRRGRPIAIGLMADPDATLAEAAERGLAVEAILTNVPVPSSDEQSVLAEDGFTLFGTEPSVQLTDWLNGQAWTPTPVDSAQALTELRADDPRRTWIRNLSTHQRSASKSTRWWWASKAL